MAQAPSTGYSPCLLVQDAIDAKFNGLNPGTLTTDVGFINAVKSPQNQGAVQFNPLPEKALPTADGKVKITASFMPFICDQESEAPVDNCDLGEGDSPTYLYEDFYIDTVSNVKWQLKDDDFRSMCESAGTQFNDMVSRKTDEFLRIVNRKSLVQSTGLFGNYPGTGTNSYANPATLPVVNPAFLFNPQAPAIVSALYKRMLLGEVTPMMVGAGYMDYVPGTAGFSGMSDDGVNRASRAGLENYFRDSQIDTILDPQTLLTWAPGAIQMLTWNKHVGAEAYSTPLNRLGSYDGIAPATTAYEKQFVTIDINGLLVDFYYEYTCDGLHKFALQLHHGIVGLPAASFADCQDFNFALAFEMACGEMNCDILAQFEPTEEES